MTKSPLVSAIIPVRNRSNARLENCLRSLRWQDIPSEKYEILISDFGSEPCEAQKLKDLADRYEGRIVRFDTDEIWNRSRALNHGIREALGRYVFCTDADMIFEPTFLATLLAAQQENRENALVVCRCRDLPESVPERIRSKEEYPALLGEAAFRKNFGGTGACQMALRSYFEEVRGYDEGFKFWGMEDNDMKFRATRHGLRLAWVHEDTSMLHQWHPSDRGKKPVSKLLNDLRFYVSRYRVKKNPKGWGGLP